MYSDPSAPFDALPDPDQHPWFYAGVPFKRLIAWLIDGVFIGVLTFLAGILTLTLAWWLWPLAFAVIGFVYRVLTLSGQSATWGMRVMGIELRTAHGDRFNGSDAVMHTLAYTLSLLFMIVQAISIVLMLATPRGQGLHDLLLGTVAINRTA
ncbi:putative RDD family membrane protein YckC [Rubricella aquisinus]|uniref:Putative RDD family membrane protein YckC n=1 Tax=Rubricella aquisinus TaxID=2028108 RepID=A0A840X1Q9_9RHOB|nr:RDD family protein [Rubricella aquisinus]MBB5515825.1 putative RDD family membrane protein YckC [Rubricella aquisinus]